MKTTKYGKSACELELEAIARPQIARGTEDGSPPQVPLPAQNPPPAPLLTPGAEEPIPDEEYDDDLEGEYELADEFDCTTQQGLIPSGMITDYSDKKKKQEPVEGNRAWRRQQGPKRPSPYGQAGPDIPGWDGK